MNKNSDMSKFVNKIIAFMELKIVQTISLLLIIAASIHLFFVGQKQSGDGHWFLVLSVIALLNIMAIYSGNRKYEKVGKYFAMITILCSFMLVILSAIIYLAIFCL